ncbi:MAG: response regulator transcription factor, partial [Caldilineaceae bacterium]
DIVVESMQNVIPTPGSLSERELEILVLISDGLTNRQIGNQLNLATNTVKGYVSSTFDKLGVNSRAQAVAIGKNRGLI